MVEFLREFLPVVIVAALIGSFSLAFFFAWLALKKHKDETDDKERSISDKELIRRLLVYGKPHWKSFVAVLGIMIISVAYDVLSPLLMKDAPILILDDSVSAVDTKTERTILENLRTTRGGKTTILIAHRISTIENMDKVLFIEDGRVAAFGKHEELYATCPAYTKMVDLQRLEEEGGEHNG